MAPTRATELQFDVQTKRSDLGRHFGTNQVLAGDKKRRKKKAIESPNEFKWLIELDGGGERVVVFSLGLH